MSTPGIPSGDEPLFSVIVATRDRPDLLREAVASVLSQSEQRFELIVVDDGGTIPVSLEADPRIVIVRRPSSGGPAAARNAGLDRARGIYVTFLDDDDAYTPERLAFGLESMSSAPIGVCWMRPMHLPPGGERSVRGLSRGENRRLEGDVRRVIVERMRPHLGQVTIRREVAPRFDERLSGPEDFEWWIRASQAGTVSTVPAVGFLLRRHLGSRITSSVRQRDRIDANLRLLEIQADYYRKVPRARAFEWRRIGVLAEQIGDRPLARTAYGRSFLSHPSRRSLTRLLRSVLPVNRRGTSERENQDP